MENKMTPEARMRAVFEHLRQDDMDGLVSHWAEDGVYFNPTVGAPAEGKADVKSTIARMSDGLQQRQETLVVDRVTEVTGVSPPRAYVEWHVESEGPRNGRLGLHVVTFNSDGLLNHVIVFAHA
jgi:ketosteroid isomerase-like protein